MKLSKINTEIIGERILPADATDITINVIITDAGITLHFEPNQNELRSYLCFLKEEENCVSNAINKIKEIKKALPKKVSLTINGEESISQYIVELEESINFSKQVIKELKTIDEKKENKKEE